MAKSYINLSLSLAGFIACLSTETVQAGSNLGANTNSNKKLYHDRKGSQIEEIFRKLPSVENEVESVFENASFFSSFGASPQTDQKSNEDVEGLFRRILLSQEKGQEKVESRNLSFLNDHLQDAGVFGGSGNVRNRGSVRGSDGGTNGNMMSSSETQYVFADQLSPGSTNSAIPHSHPHSEDEASLRNIVKIGKSMKGFEGIGGYHKKKEHKEMKKAKRYKGAEETSKIDHKLMKSTKSGKKDKTFGYDPYDANDDLYALSDDFHFDNWEWEWVKEEELTQTSTQFDGGNSQFKDTGFGGITGWRSEPFAAVDGVGGMMGRVESVTEEGQYEFANFLNNMDGPVGPVTITTKQVGNYKFNFPTIQHMVFSGPIHLKANSPIDLSSMDPEIFAVLQSILTPYLQQTMGSTLHAYNLEVDYSPTNDKNAGKYDVVTLMEIKCAFKVISDSIESFRLIDHTQASRWLHDFFAGPQIYKLIEALKSDNIPINDIVFISQEFEISKTVSEANSQSIGKSPVSNTNSEKSSSGVAMVGITLSVIIVGMLFFMHHTGRLPSKAQIGDFSLNARDSIAKRMPSSIILGKKKRGNGDEIEGRRRRTFSGTFRRFPEGGLQKAAIQKKPAQSEQYLGDSASDSSSSSGIPVSCKKSSSFADMLDHDDYSFSQYSGDYNPATPSRQSSVPMTPVSRQTDDEFSSPDTYDSAHEGRETLLGKVGKTASYLLSPGINRQQRQQPYAVKSPIPRRAPRRITARDIASPNEVDSWSIQSYETGTPSVRTPSNHPLYRGWNETGSEMRRPQSPPGHKTSRSSRENLTMPHFS